MKREATNSTPASSIERGMAKAMRLQIVPLFLVCLLLFCVSPLVSAHASRGYACDDQPCSQARKEYVDRWAGVVCSMSRSLKSLMDRKDRAEGVLSRLEARLRRCLARNPRRPAACTYHLRRVQNLNRGIADLQRRIDRLVARLQGSCRASLPNGVPGVPPTCEENEATQYCPVMTADDAVASLERRCADLEAEKALRPLCDNCVAPDNPLVAIVIANPDVATRFECSIPPALATAVPTALATQVPVA